MEKMMLLRSIRRAAACSRSSLSTGIIHRQLWHHLASRSIFSLSSPSVAAPFYRMPSSGYDYAIGIGSRRYFCQDVNRLPTMQDPEIKDAFEGLMAENWDEIPNSVISDVKKALSKTTGDNAGQEVLTNVFRAAEAVEEFCGMLMNLKMELDDSIGMSGEDVKPLPDDFRSALRTAYQRYSAYLDSFGPDEAYLRKKVETDLGSKMIYLKMRCGGLGSEWGKVTVLGTSGLAGSYVEHRA